MLKLRVLNCVILLIVFAVNVCNSDNSRYDDQHDDSGRFDVDDDGSYTFSHSTSHINLNDNQNLYGTKIRGQRLKNIKNGKDYIYFKFKQKNNIGYSCILCFVYKIFIQNQDKRLFLISLYKL